MKFSVMTDLSIGVADRGFAFSLLLIGPSILLKIPSKESLVILGLAIMGISSANSAAFVTDEAVAGALSEYPDRN